MFDQDYPYTNEVKADLVEEFKDSVVLVVHIPLSHHLFLSKGLKMASNLTFIAL